MGLRIKTNVNSLSAQRNMANNTAQLDLHTQRLSSGFRINKAADDAAGLAISTKLEAQVRGLNQAKRNASDAISLVQTAEGGLNEISNIIVRLKELSVQAASDTIGNQERGFLQKEFSQLKYEIERIAYSSEFNGTRLLTGDRELPYEMAKNSNVSPLEFQVGSNYFESVDHISLQNPVHVIKLDLREINATLEGEGSLELGQPTSEFGVRIDAKESAQKTIQVVDKAIEKVSEYRSTLGAVQNRLQSSINNLGIQMENLSSAKSRIKDADFAEETSQATQYRILQQAGLSVLAQANQMPEMALKLLN
jgi:flagellin